jgi:SAM-dependent methyltransferase
VSNLALSSRSTTTVARKFSSPDGVDVVLPYTLFEFGFPDHRKLKPLPDRPQFTDEAGTRFMSSDAGSQLRVLERQYNAVLRQYVTRSVRLSGARILILGSGSSREIVPLLNRGVASAVFVDTSQAALDTLEANLAAAGVLAHLDAEFVCMDAWSFLCLDDSPEYDLVMAIKCLGMVFAVDPSVRHARSLLELCADVVREDGSVILDHHLAFSSGPHGTKIVDVCPPEHYGLATIGGRYSSDVCYSASVAPPSFDLVATFAPARSAHLVQSWQVFHYRSLVKASTSLGTVVSAHRPCVPKEFVAPPPQEYDPVVDAMIPVNSRGVKRVPTFGDLASHPVQTSLVKYDGVPGVLILDGPDAVFFSSGTRFAFALCAEVTPCLTLMAELTPASNMTSVVIVTGVISVGVARADPLNYEALRPLIPTLEALAPSGVVPTLSEHVRLLGGNSVVFPSVRGTVLKVPVDGLQLVTDGRAGVFVKPAELATVDSTAADILPLLQFAYDSLGMSSLPTVAPATRQGVLEYHRVLGTALWRPGRPRPDKRKSDTPGATMHTVLSSHRAEELNLPPDVQGLARAMLR